MGRKRIKRVGSPLTVAPRSLPPSSLPAVSALHGGTRTRRSTLTTKIKLGRWSRTEDIRLTRATRKFGEQNWKMVAKDVKTKSRDSCCMFDVRNAFPTRSHTLTHAHTRSHTLTHAHTRSHTLTHAHTRSHSGTLTHQHSGIEARRVAHRQWRTQWHTVRQSRSLREWHTVACTRSCTHVKHSHTHTGTRSDISKV
jgi:hypothetical protein